MRNVHSKNNITIRLLILLSVALIAVVYLSVKTTGSIVDVFSAKKICPQISRRDFVPNVG